MGVLTGKSDSFFPNVIVKVSPILLLAADWWWQHLVPTGEEWDFWETFPVRLSWVTPGVLLFESGYSDSIQYWQVTVAFCIRSDCSPSSALISPHSEASIRLPLMVTWWRQELALTSKS